MRVLIAVFAALGMLCSVASAEFPEKVTIGDKTIECRTVEEIRKLGFECEDIPWKDNAARLHIEAMNAYRPQPEELYEPLRKALRDFDFGDTAEEMENHFKENERTFDLLKQADLMPGYVFPMYKSEWISQATMPGLGKYVPIARLLDYHAAFQCWRGNHTDAIDDGMLMMRLGRRVSTAPVLISGMVGIAIQSIAAKRFGGIVSRGTMSDAELRNLAGRLAKGVELPSWEHALRGERAFAFASVSDFERGGYDFYEPLMKAMGGAEGVIERDAWPKEFRPDVTRKNLNAFYDFCEANAKRPIHEALLPANRIETFVKAHRDGWDKVTVLLIIGFDKAHVTYARAQVTFDALCVRVALERFRLANKGYPKTLAELVPTYLDKLPLDPFSGKPYGYRVEDDGNFLLWSVGDDLKDDGGKGNASTPWVGPDYIFTSRPETAK